MGPGDVSDLPICISDVSHHSGDPDQGLSEDDLPPEVRVVDLPPEVRINDLPPEVRVVDLPPEVRIIDLEPVFEVSPDTSEFLIRVTRKLCTASAGLGSPTMSRC